MCEVHTDTLIYVCMYICDDGILGNGKCAMCEMRLEKLAIKSSQKLYNKTKNHKLQSKNCFYIGKFFLTKSKIYKFSFAKN